MKAHSAYINYDMKCYSRKDTETVSDTKLQRATTNVGIAVTWYNICNILFYNQAEKTTPIFGMPRFTGHCYS